ncbi:cadherin-1-like isoform X1 [Bombina bombina]|uniref:cadherin-1-like isoform X1 n=1 Tax=Bombina bombina TaxID=8345 RepID=UPI00235AAD80|nr:cadherin-1-like isoform X1 [Bombina bombina]
MWGMKPGSLGIVLLLFIFLQTKEGLTEWTQCRFGFTEERYIFLVPKNVEQGQVLGKVGMNGCDSLPEIRYVSEDPDFKVQEDGIVLAKHHIKLHKPKRSFRIDAWEGRGFIQSAVVTLQRENHHHKKQQDHSGSDNHAEHLHKPKHGLKRQKRDWVIPPIKVSENQRGSFPQNIVNIRSIRDKVFYSITGQGADTPPVGVFTMDRETGWLKVNKPLDREDIDKYTLLSYAVSINGEKVEGPLEIIIEVIDQNDNTPVFTEVVFEGSVFEGSRPGTPVMTVTATDADYATNGMVAYSIVDQEPKEPSNQMFTINADTGLISVIATGLDREKYPEYTLTLKAADMQGVGNAATGKAVIKVTDTNDNPPIFNPTTYTATVPENDVGYEVERLTCTDEDTVGSEAWKAVYRIIRGNEANFFAVTTVEDNNGLLKTIKPLDFELKNQYILSITVTNVANFSVPLTTSTATVTVMVQDVNEAPIFDPAVKRINVNEDLPSGQIVASYTATDPDKTNQNITYSIGNDPANWLSVNPRNRIITGNGQLDRESLFVQNSTYTAIIIATDSGVPQATGTGTLIVTLLDVNDNAPLLEPEVVLFCQKNPEPFIVAIIDKDLPPNTGPFVSELLRGSRENWTAQVVENTLQISPLKNMDIGDYPINIKMKDNMGLVADIELSARVCYCEGSDITCDEKAITVGGLGVPASVGILVGILALLKLLLLLLLFMRFKKVVKELLLPPEDETRVDRVAVI